ncbi:Fc.00g004160.m01.CDS01 [Cosmosporella sp. VM-42]
MVDGNQLHAVNKVPLNVDLGTETFHSDVPPLVGDEIPTVPFHSMPSGLECPMKHTTDSDGYTSRLAELMKDAMMYGSTLQREQDRPFLPLSALHGFITQDAVERCLQEPLPRGSHLDRSRRIFAILVMVGNVSAFRDFMSAGLHDDDLPFHLNNSCVDGNAQLEVRSELTPEKDINYFQRLGRTAAASFLEWQWSFITPSFSPLDSQTLQATFHDFHDQTILPFTRAECFNSGSFGTVYRVRIPKEYIDTRFIETSSSSKEATRCYAVKMLHSKDKRAVRQEVAALQLLNSEANPNIIRLLGTYRIADRFYLLFPWADYDLAMFWRLNPTPEADPTTVRWVAKQMLGLADGLVALHDSKPDDSGRRWSVVHMDLKPENILVFSGDTGGGLHDCVWKLSDFGHSSISIDRTEVVYQDRKRSHTPVYRAPELDLWHHELFPSYDIWSLGCVLSEIVTWLLSGSKGLEELRNARADTGKGNSNHDAFFQVGNTIDGGGGVALKSGVQDWFLHLQHHPRSSSFTDEVLALITQGMLILETTPVPSRRSSSWDVHESLFRMCKELESNALYSKFRGVYALVQDREMETREVVDMNQSLQGNQKLQTAITSLISSFSVLKSLPLTIGALQVYTTFEPSGKRKRLETDHAADAGDGRSKRISGQLNPEEPEKAPFKFACPYFKAGFDRSQLSRACLGPGWAQIHRVKEHVFRNHTPESFKKPLVCGRCLEGFKSQGLVMQHLREEPQCLIKAPEVTNGKVSLEQAVNMRSTKRRSDMTDEDKWFEWYRILFPSKYPSKLSLSPYYEDLTVSSLATLSTQSSTDMTDYKEYLRRPLAEDKQQALEAELGTALGISNPDMCRILAAKFREYQLRDVQQFDEANVKPTYGIPLNKNAPKTVTGQDNYLGLFDPENSYDQLIMGWDNAESQVGTWDDPGTI